MIVNVNVVEGERKCVQAYEGAVIGQNRFQSRQQNKRDALGVPFVFWDH